MKTNGDNLIKMLNQHSTWILSLGKTGRLADLKAGIWMILILKWQIF
jgi:hypothetical protein